MKESVVSRRVKQAARAERALRVLAAALLAAGQLEAAAYVLSAAETTGKAVKVGRVWVAAERLGAAARGRGGRVAARAAGSSFRRLLREKYPGGWL